MPVRGDVLSVRRLGWFCRALEFFCPAIRNSVRKSDDGNSAGVASGLQRPRMEVFSYPLGWSTGRRFLSSSAAGSRRRFVARRTVLWPPPGLRSDDSLLDGHCRSGDQNAEVARSEARSCSDIRLSRRIPGGRVRDETRGAARLASRQGPKDLGSESPGGSLLIRSQSQVDIRTERPSGIPRRVLWRAASQQLRLRADDHLGGADHRLPRNGRRHHAGDPAPRPATAHTVV